MFAAGSEGHELHPAIDERAGAAAKRVSKTVASIFEGTGLIEWLRSESIDTITLTGHDDEQLRGRVSSGGRTLGFTVEVLADATGAFPLSNDAGVASAAQVHETLMTLLNSNWAAVTNTDAWVSAVKDGSTVTGGNLVESAIAGRAST